MSGKSVTSTLFTFKCWIGLAEGFPVILRTIVQTFFIEVRLLILDTKECQDLRLVDFILRLVLARTIWRFTILAGVGDVFTFRVSCSLWFTSADGFPASVWRLRENNEKVHNDPKRYKDPKFYNDPKQYDEFLRYIFVSYSAASTVTSDRPFHQFRWHCQHCLFPANSPAQFASHVIAPVAPKTLKYFADTVTIPTPHQDNYINTWTSLGSTHNTHRYRHTPSIITDPGHHHHHHLLSLLHLFHWHSQHYNASQLSWRPWWSLNFSWPHLEWPWRHPFSRLFSAFDLVYSFSQHSITDTSARIPPIRKQHHITHVTSQHIIPSFPTIYHFIRHFILMSIAITLTHTHHTTRYIYCSFNSSYFSLLLLLLFLPSTPTTHPCYSSLPSTLSQAWQIPTYAFLLPSRPCSWHVSISFLSSEPPSSRPNDCRWIIKRYSFPALPILSDITTIIISV